MHDNIEAAAMDFGIIYVVNTIKADEFYTALNVDS